MKEEAMLAQVNAGLETDGIEDRVTAAGLFYPRGHTGGMFLGGLAAPDLHGAGTALGSLGGARAADARTGLPARMWVGVSATHVYGFEAQAGREEAPSRLLFRLERSRLEVRVHPRVNVRVLELVDRETGSKVELEGPRPRPAHAGDVIAALEA